MSSHARMNKCSCSSFPSFLLFSRSSSSPCPYPPQPPYLSLPPSLFPLSPHSLYFLPCIPLTPPCSHTHVLSTPHTLFRVVIVLIPLRRPLLSSFSYCVSVCLCAASQCMCVSLRGKVGQGRHSYKATFDLQLLLFSPFSCGSFSSSLSTAVPIATLPSGTPMHTRLSQRAYAGP